MLSTRMSPEDLATVMLLRRIKELDKLLSVAAPDDLEDVHRRRCRCVGLLDSILSHDIPANEVLNRAKSVVER